MDMPIFMVVVLMGACGPYADPISPGGDPKCGTQELGKLTVLYGSELDTVCRGAHSIEECTTADRDAVDKKYEKLFKEWAECE